MPQLPNETTKLPDDHNHHENLPSSSRPQRAPQHEKGRLNVFIPWVEGGRRLPQMFFSTLESVLWHHPSASVRVLTTGSEGGHLDGALEAYVRHGYSVEWLGVDAVWWDLPIEAMRVLAAWLERGQRDLATGLMCFIMQLRLGGVCLPPHGVLLNALDAFLPSTLFDGSLGSNSGDERSVTVVFEIADRRPAVYSIATDGLKAAHSQRPFTCRHESTRLCVSDCPSFIPANSTFGKQVLDLIVSHSEMASTVVDSQYISFFDLIHTVAYDAYLQTRRRTGDGGLNGELVVGMPPSVIMEDIFPDFHGFERSMRATFFSQSFHSQLYRARETYEASDWALATTAKLWLPLPPHLTRTPMPRSVIDLALTHFQLGHAPHPYGTMRGLADGEGDEGPGYRLVTHMRPFLPFFRSPAYKTEHYSSWLPGVLGGARDFRAVRVTQKASARDEEGGTFRVQIRSCVPLRMGCRASQSPFAESATSEDGPSMRVRVGWHAAEQKECERGLQQPLGGRAAGGREDILSRPSVCPHLVFDLEGTEASTNGAMSMLYFTPVGRPSPPSPPNNQPPHCINTTLSGDTVKRDPCPVTVVTEVPAQPSLSLTDVADGRLAAKGNGTVLAGDDGLLQCEIDWTCMRVGVNPAIFGWVNVTLALLTRGKGGKAPVVWRGMSRVLLVDVEDVVTVVAHSGGRCWILDRMARSIRLLYPRMPIVVTCEREGDLQQAQADDGPEGGLITKSAHSSIPNMTVLSVPFDYGLARAKNLLVSLITTEFTLVLDDDFVTSPHTCVECMLEKMTNQLHLGHPFDIVGFPIREDEEDFGAFRGLLKVGQGAVYMEAGAWASYADGCQRVDLVPMVFLARTLRLREVPLQEDLKLGEHEKFFYMAKRKGLQVGVCFDSSLTHLRLSPDEMTTRYANRRERSGKYMREALTEFSVTRLAHFMRQYAPSSSPMDHAMLISDAIPPWTVGNHNHHCQQTAFLLPPPHGFSLLLLVIVMTTPDRRGRDARDALRRRGSWLRALSGVPDNGISAYFAMPAPASGNHCADGLSEGWREVVGEYEEHGDMVWVTLPPTMAEPLSHLDRVPPGEMRRANMASQDDPDQYKLFLNEPMMRGPLHGHGVAANCTGCTNEKTPWTSQLYLSVLESFRAMDSNWVMVVRDDVFVDLKLFTDLMGDKAMPYWTVVAPPADKGAPAPRGARTAVLKPVGLRIDVSMVLYRRELYLLLTSRPLVDSLRHDDGGSLEGSVNRWLDALNVYWTPLPSFHVGRPTDG
ncbi:unnamed protein product [Vitrella brassicaformis CCMP3155]|uniref:Glycosyltransferase 2-like domain-containing protein n=1 Tax=Vitrella brassicaformis (strain CCMP3155) TaxID=1169540 RepID=A0A0G4FW08_VITBC|nr:unnamed protein product [Vitrella brassicaformis CCMP3155]|eukprot:CEM19287.1 unnamed protein product [Vitrella brassicaformis CCMP3155]